MLQRATRHIRGLLPLTLAACAVSGTGLAAGDRGAPFVRGWETTFSLSERMKPLPVLNFAGRAPAPGDAVISVDERQRFQRIHGFGAAITDSSAALIHDLAPGTRTRLMRQLFTNEGIRMNFVRIALGASDFTAGRRPYSYDDATRPDLPLHGFSIAHDNQAIIPVLRQMRALNPAVLIDAAPWSMPGWMKSDGSMVAVNRDDSLIDAPWALGAMADYETRALAAYARAGVPVNVLVPQNEPTAVASYPTMYLTEQREAALVPMLARRLRAAGLHTSIFGGDDSFNATAYHGALAGDLAGDRSLAGIAWHCYFGDPAAMSRLSAAYPRLDAIEDECSPEIRGMQTISFMIDALRNGASAFILWNAALDPSGGPVQPPNQGCTGCNGLVTVQGGNYTLGRKYYELGQFSRFVPRGSHRIASNTLATPYTDIHNHPHITAGIDDVALESHRGTIILVVANTGAGRTIAVRWHGRVLRRYMPASSSATLQWSAR